MSKKIKLGIVGCGEATQILHIPSLRELPELFDVVALCDVSPGVLAEVGARVPQASRHAGAEALIADPQVEAVLVANPNAFHAEVALAAMRRGKHVLIEKPVCVTQAQGEALLAAEREYGVTAQVGYMRRHAPAFVQALSLIAGERGNITLARVHDVIGPNASFVNSTTRLVARGGDVPQAVIDAGNAKQAEQFLGEIGVSEGPLARAYMIMLGLVSHDTSAMRELLGGPPQRVLYARQQAQGRWISAAFDYGHFVCHLEVGLDQITRFDGHLEVYLPGKVVRVEYDTPYVRHQGARLLLTEASGAHGVASSVTVPTRNDAFVAEWRSFHDHVTHHTRPKCSINDALEDLALFREMIRLMR